VLIIHKGEGMLLDPGGHMVERFINWIENLQVGVDLMAQDRYRVPV
jgi:flavorubredoxin